MSGFDGGCGIQPPSVLPPPIVPPVTETDCVDLLTEAACSADATCNAVYVESFCACDAACHDDGNGGCLPCECAGNRTFVGCQEIPVVTGCEALDETACLADATCEPIYSQCGATAPGSGAESPGDEFRAPVPCDPASGERCGCNEAPVFGGCQPRGHECPAVCDIFCPFGNVIDANGCETCSCNPGPGRCGGLDEQQCLNASPACSAVYASSGAERDPPSGGGSGAACDPASNNCGSPIAPPQFIECIDNFPVGCENLDEAQCSQTPGCHGEYLETPCARPCDPSTGSCGDEGDRVSCPPAFVCRPDETKPECWSDADCGRGYVCAFSTDVDGGNGGGALRPDPAQPAPPPPQGGVCVLVNNGGCNSDVDCPTGYCDYSGFGPDADRAQPAPPEEEDPTQPPPPPGGQCIAVSCGDGTSILCDAVAPSCGPGAVAGALNGCYGCYDARSCTLLDQPTFCTSDAECPNGYCDPAIRGGARPGGGDEAAFPAPPGGQCVYPVCGDGSQLMCRSLQPECGEGFTAAVVNGCWDCLDARACSSPVPPPCAGSDSVDCG